MFAVKQIASALLISFLLSGCSGTTLGHVGCMMEAMGDGLQGRRNYGPSQDCADLQAADVARAQAASAPKWIVLPGQEQRFISDAYQCARETGTAPGAGYWSLCMAASGWQSVPRE